MDVPRLSCGPEMDSPSLGKSLEQKRKMPDSTWSYIRNQCAKAGCRIAIAKWRGRRYSYSELIEAVDTLGQRFRKIYSRSSGPVVVACDCALNSVLGLLALNSAGIACVPVGARATPARLAGVVERLRAASVLTDARGAERIANVGLSCSVLALDISIEDDPVHTRSTGDALQEDAAFIMWTSGTSGSANAVMLSNRNIVSNLEAIRTYFDLPAGDRLLVVRSVDNISALTGEIFFGLSIGATVTFFDEGFMPHRIVRAICEERVSTLCCTPSALRYLTKYNVFGACESLRRVALSGEILRVGMAREFARSYRAIDFYNVYGMTEMAPRITALKPERFESKPGSVGTPVDGVRVHVVDELGNRVRPGEIGEIVASGPGMMIGYYNEPARTQRRKRNRMMFTRDLGYFDPDGYLYVVGRMDDTINRAGRKIHAEELEARLSCIPEVEDAVVWGEPDGTVGEAVCAAIVPLNSDIDLRNMVSIIHRDLGPEVSPDRLCLRSSLLTNRRGKAVRSHEQWA